MKRILATLLFITMSTLQAQEQKTVTPQVSVSGEGKIKVTPDQCEITLGVESIGKDAATAQKANDEIIDRVIKYIKSHNIPLSDFKTTNVNLYKNYDYEKKKHNFHANQTLSVFLKDIKKYNDFMMNITEVGITNIGGVEFKSSKLEELEREARVKAMLNAKQKANDFVTALGQKVGKLLLVTDNSATVYTQPVFRAMATEMAVTADTSRETVALGEINIAVNVQVSFAIE